MPLPWKEAYQRKVIEPCDLARKIKEIKEQGLTIATINGSFDLLHAGHLHSLYEGSKQADCFIVALNSDASIKQYKSPLRPIITLMYRLQMMAALSFVDFVTWFDETDPRAILNIIQPSVHINGAEYGSDCIEAETVLQYGGKLHLIDRIDSLSTTAVIQSVKKICD